eukprot:jgi/Botrbrau1/4965/Bobra.0122s0040.1
MRTLQVRIARGTRRQSTGHCCLKLLSAEIRGCPCRHHGLRAQCLRCTTRRYWRRAAKLCGCAGQLGIPYAALTALLRLLSRLAPALAARDSGQGHVLYLTMRRSALSSGPRRAGPSDRGTTILLRAHCTASKLRGQTRPDHKPMFHKGLVIKHNVNQRYATTSVSAALFREVGSREGIPTQEFSVRSDMACGSTIGPILASLLGCRTVDVGAPQLAMHSIREMCAVDDISHAVRHFTAFFRNFSALDALLDETSVSPSQIIGSIEEVPCDHVKLDEK